MFGLFGGYDVIGTHDYSLVSIVVWFVICPAADSATCFMRCSCIHVRNSVIIMIMNTLCVLSVHSMRTQ